MRRNHWLALAAVAILTVTLLGANGLAPEPTRVAICDVHRAVRSYQRFSDIADRVEAAERDYREQGKAMSEDLEKKVQQLQMLNENSPEYQKLDREIWEQTYEIRVFQEVRKGELQREQRRGLMACYEDVRAEVKAYCDETGYDLVLYEGEVPTDAARNLEELESLITSRRILYAADRLDITQDVLDRLNASYRAEQGTD